MFDKFGEFDSFSEINELAENLLNEGDIESLKVVAKENGIQADFVDLYTNGEIPELCDKLTAALGKIDVEAAELKPKEIMEDWVEYLRGQCMENELFSQTGPRMLHCFSILQWSHRHTYCRLCQPGFHASCNIESAHHGNTHDQLCTVLLFQVVPWCLPVCPSVLPGVSCALALLCLSFLLM